MLNYRLMQESPRDITSLGQSNDLAVEARVRRARRTGDTQVDESIRRFAIEAAQLCHDTHCSDVLVLDVRGLSDLFDYLVIASGTSDRQIKSLADDLEDLGRDNGHERFGRDLDGPATWLVLDFVDVVVHLFEPAARAHYDLEMLWGDASQVSWRRSGGKSPQESS